MTIKTRIDQLRKDLRRYEYAYHVENNAIVSDEVYDDLYNELKGLEKQNPDLITADSPTQRVGAKLQDGFTEVRHSVPMLSLENAYGPDDMARFFDKIAAVCH